MSGNQSYDNRSTHDMFCIIEGQTMESQSLVSLNYTLFVCGAFPGLLLTIIMIVFIVIH